MMVVAVTRGVMLMTGREMLMLNLHLFRSVDGHEPGDPTVHVDAVAAEVPCLVSIVS